MYVEFELRSLKHYNIHLLVERIPPITPQHKTLGCENILKWLSAILSRVTELAR